MRIWKDRYILVSLTLFISILQSPSRYTAYPSKFFIRWNSMNLLPNPASLPHLPQTAIFKPNEFTFTSPPSNPLTTPHHPEKTSHLQSIQSIPTSPLHIQFLGISSTTHQPNQTKTISPSNQTPKNPPFHHFHHPIYIQTPHQPPQVSPSIQSHSNPSIWVPNHPSQQPTANTNTTSKPEYLITKLVSLADDHMIGSRRISTRYY